MKEYQVINRRGQRFTIVARSKTEAVDTAVENGDIGGPQEVKRVRCVGKPDEADSLLY